MQTPWKPTVTELHTPGAAVERVAAAAEDIATQHQHAARHAAMSGRGDHHVPVALADAFTAFAAALRA